MYYLIIITEKIQNLFCFFSLVSIILLFRLILLPQVGQAQIIITSLDTYSQNFNSLPASGSVTLVNKITVPGWHVVAGSSSIVSANDGSSSATGLYSFGKDGTDVDRSLGGLNSNAAGDFFYGVHFKNNTGSPIGHFEISFAMEQWRRGTGNGETMTFDYRTGTSLALTSGTWTTVTHLNANPPSTTSKPGARNGNNERIEKSLTISDINLAPSQEIIFRWKDPQFSGYGLSLDDVKITPLSQTAFDDTQPLPVELLYFHASAAANAVHLEWVTASETNNDFFAVERSTDGTSFKEVAQVKGAGNTTAKTIYTAIDKAPFAGTSYYRLKQADFGGKVTYSPIQVVSVKRQDQLLLSLYPNPAQNAPINLRVEGLGAEHPVEVKVTDMMGRNLLHISFRADAAALEASLINAGDLKPGTYIVTISSGHRSKTQRLLIK